MYGAILLRFEECMVLSHLLNLRGFRRFVNLKLHLSMFDAEKFRTMNFIKIKKPGENSPGNPI